MLSKCANPTCSTAFRYLHEGILFYLAVASAAPVTPDSSDKSVLERFWLCDKCSKTMKVIPTRSGVVVVNLQSQTEREENGIMATPNELT